MTKSELIKLFGLIIAWFPKDVAFAKSTEIMETAWLAMLKDLPYDCVEKALQMHTALSQFSPSIAELRSNAAKIQHPELMRTAEDAWMIVRDVMRRIPLGEAVVTYDADGKQIRKTSTDRARELTPKDVWECVEKVGGYYDMCKSDNLDVLRGQFTKAWENLSRQKLSMLAFPPQIREVLSPEAIGEGESKNLLTEGKNNGKSGT